MLWVSAVKNNISGQIWKISTNISDIETWFSTEEKYIDSYRTIGRGLHVVFTLYG